MDCGERVVAAGPTAAQAGQEEQKAEEHDEWKSRAEPGREHVAARQVAAEQLLEQAEDDPAEEGVREASQAACRRSGHRGNKEHREVERLQVAEHGS